MSDAHVIKFQCPNCGHELQQTVGSLKLGNRMRCQGCDIGINIDTNRLASAAEEMRSALERAPPEITIKFFR
jgi:transcription elongation factor Elf1